MQRSANHDGLSIVLDPERRLVLNTELDLHFETKMHEQSGLSAIEDREIVLDGWAVLDMLAGRDFDAARVRRVLEEVTADIDRDLPWDSDQSFIDLQLDRRSACTTVLAQIGGPR